MSVPPLEQREAVLGNGDGCYCYAQGNDGGTLNTFLVLLDNQSIVNVFCDEEFLVDIPNIPKSITIRTNGGETVVNTVERFLGYGWV